MNEVRVWRKKIATEKKKPYVPAECFVFTEESQVSYLSMATRLENQSAFSCFFGTGVLKENMLIIKRIEEGNRTPIAKLATLFLIIGILMGLGSPAFGKDTADYSLGFRTGFSMSGSLEETFNLYEAIGSVALPWSYTWESGWLFTTEVDITAGIQRAVQDNGFIASAGPAIAVTIPPGWMSFLAAVRVAYLDDYEFGEVDLGGRLSFVEELGVEFSIYSGLKAGYRIRHMSNAGIYDKNPGLNMHIIELRYRF